ncbi:MAG: beta-ketoacyl synthase N-terminal-like domain-containing protein [Isosphaeraceae bacterium]
MNPVDPNQPVPVAIIGMACLFPKADDLTRYWSNIRNRVDAITEVPPTHWRPEDYFDDDPKSPDRTYARRGGFLDPVDFPPLDFGIAPNNLEATDTTQLLGLMVARQALEDAGYGDGTARGKTLDRGRVSTILGVTGTLELVIPLGARLGHPIWRRALKEAGVPTDQADEVVRRIADSYVGWQENSFPGLLGNVAAGRIANRLDLGGTNCVIDAACASSIGALNLALLELSSGRCDVALSGGLDTFNDIFMYMCFSKTPALSPRGDARPFDAGCDGTILGEGLGVVVLKRLDDARRDGDRIYAVIRSVGSSSDGKGNAVYAPSASGQARCLVDAYQQAGVTPDTIELVEAHGTGTKVGDATELAALHSAYGEHRPGDVVRSGRSSRRSGIPRRPPGSRDHQGGPRAAPQGPPAHDQGRHARRGGRSRSVSLLRQHRASTLAAPTGPSARAAVKRLWLRGQQLPLRPRGGRSGQVDHRLGRLRFVAGLLRAEPRRHPRRARRHPRRPRRLRAPTPCLRVTSPVPE